MSTLGALAGVDIRGLLRGAAAMDVGEEEASLISRARGCEVVDIRDAAGRSLPHFAFEHDKKER